MRARALRRADDGAEVMRVRQIVAQDDEGRFSPAFRVFEDLIDRGVGVGRDHGDDALMRAGGGELIELAPVGLDDGSSSLLRHGGEAGKGAVGLAGGDIELVDRAAGSERFLHGVAALEHIFCRLRGLLRAAQGRAAVIAVPFFLFHDLSSFRVISSEFLLIVFHGIV